MRSSLIYLPLLLLGMAIAGASLLFLSPGAASDQIDLTGDWEFTIAGDFSASCDLDIEQTGTSISGTFDCDDGTSGGFAGTITQEVSGASLDLDLTIVPLIGPTVSADAEGTVPADGNSFTGTWDAPGFGMSGTFDGTRLSGPPPTPSPSPSPSPTPNAKIHSVEFTQAIQEWQTIEELKSDLQADQSPPVPMIEGKPGTIRVYLTEVEDVTTVKVQASGSVSGTKNVTLLPGCTPEKRRKQEGSCDSVNFDFAGAPSGFWNVNITLKNDEGDVLEQHSFNLKSVEADTLALKAVKVCDTPGAGVFTPWQCSNPMRLATLAQYLRKVAPTDSVIVSNSGDVIYRNASGYANPKDWWKDVTLDIEDLFSAFDALAGVAGQERYYFGMVRPEGPGGLLGRASGVPGRGGAAKEVSSTLGVDDSHLTTAHEVGHMLGVRHTNKGVPSGGFPACYATAPDNNTDWAYADNRLRSGSAPGTIEVGFDVATKMALDGSRVFELMGYCNPQWVSPRTYGQMLAALGGGSPSALPASQSTEGDYWLVSGEILEDAAVLRPLFTISTTGSAAAGTGDYSIEVRDEVGSVLFERFFTPIESSARPEPGEDSPPPAYIFSELIPVQAGAATLVVLDGSAAEIGSIQIDGALPDVTVSVDDGGASAQNSLVISWTIEDADSSDHTVWLDYSPNGGQDWTNLGMRHGGAGLTIDPEDLPGSGNAVVRVLASDGVNTGAAVSEPFSVAKKPPEAEILFPGDSDVFGFGDVVWFQGLAFDADDGSLEGASVRWSSSIDGPLGTGTNLPLTDLSVGEHVVTLEVTDSDDNVVTDEITVVIGDADVDETVLPTPTPTGPTATPAPTATSTPTTTVTPTPTPTPGGELTQGDADCDGDVDAVDALKTLQYVAALEFTQEPGCPEIGSTLIAAAAPAGADPIFGDVDCDEDVDAVDALQILRFVAGLQVNQGAGCKPIGV